MDLNKRSTPDNGLRGDGLGDLLEESLAEFGNMVLVAGWAEVASFAGEGQKKIFVAAGIAADQDKAFIINLQHKH